MAATQRRLIAMNISLSTARRRYSRAGRMQAAGRGPVPSEQLIAEEDICQEPASKNEPEAAASPYSSAAASKEPIRPVDQLVLDLLRQHNSLSVADLTDKLEVTATAIRQRLDRLESAGLIEKQKRSGGRGRPTFGYALSEAGWRRVGVDYHQLALAMWESLEALGDAPVRQELLDAIAQRLGESYARKLPAGTLGQRLAAMQDVLGEQKVPTRLDEQQLMLEVQACPFPDLTGESHSICQLEQQALSIAFGLPIVRSCCRNDGSGYCQYHVRPEAESTPSKV